MGAIVVTGAALLCTFGTMSANLTATSQTMLMCDGKPAATVQDAAPLVNIPALGMCSSLANPQVAAATAAALGVLTPQPCIPATGCWFPTQMKCIAGGSPCVTNDATCICAYGGTLSITNPGQNKVVI